MNGRTNFNGSMYLACCRRNVYSQYGEDGVVDAVIEATGDGKRWAFECGAADGVMFSNTRRLLDRGWTVAMVDADERYATPLLALASRFPSLIVRGDRLAPDGLDRMLGAMNAPDEPTLICIDIDGADWHAWNGMLMYYPRVVVIEHSTYDEYRDRVPDIGDTWQAGPRAVERLASSKGYHVVAQTFTNSICLRSDLVPQLREAEREWYDKNASIISRTSQ